MKQDIAGLRRQLSQLQELHASGVLSKAQFEEGKAPLERRILNLVMSGAADAAPVSTAAVPQGSAAAGQAGGSTAAVAPPARSRKLLAALASGVVVLAAAGYWYTGSPDQMTSGPQVVAGTKPVGVQPTAPHATSQKQVADMAEKLALRMQDTPEDAEGWAMLARSYAVLGRHPEALVAYEKAVNLRQDDATLLADYADSLAVKNGRKLTGEPMKWVEAALKLDPRNPKALALAGTHAFGLRDYASAVMYWEQVVQSGPPDSGYVQQLHAGLARARQLGGLPAVPGLQVTDAPTSGAPVILSGPLASGSVSLTPGLARLASPDDTVFIYVRAADGAQRMPLAIQRIQVRQLPFSFVLDESASMSPAARMSGVKSVVVSARVSKSGQAMPAPGDLIGQSAPVEVGASGLSIEIRDQVK